MHDESREEALRTAVDRQTPIDIEDAVTALRSDDIGTQSVGYAAITSGQTKGRLDKLTIHSDVPMMALKYLVRCILLDLPGTDDSYIHSRGEAFLDLSAPLADYWSEFGGTLDQDIYWQTIEEFLRSSHPAFFPELATHFLEGLKFRSGFSRRKSHWRSDPVLTRYLMDLDKTLGRRPGKT